MKKGALHVPKKYCRHGSTFDLQYLGPYSTTILKNILCLFLQDFPFKFECNPTSDWLNIQKLLNIEKSGE